MSDYKPMEEWLETWYSKKSSRGVQRRFFQVYLEWTQKTPKELVEEFEQKKARDLILKLQNYLKNEVIVKKGRRKGQKGLLDNAVRSHVNAVRAFYSSQCEEVKGLKKKVISAKKAKGEHAFTIGDLQKIWHISDTRDKAIIAVGCSLGWEASAFLAMDRDFFEALIKRAREQNLEFISFEWQREKTGSKQFGILTPCAIDSLERWINHKESRKKEGLWNGLTQDGLNKVLKRLTKEANIITTGRIRWHLLRKWLMNTLSRSLNSWEVKIVLGKTVPTTDLTYLQTLKQSAFEKYKELYPLNMSLVSYSNDTRKIGSLKEAIEIVVKAIVKSAEKELGMVHITEEEAEPIKKEMTLTVDLTLSDVEKLKTILGTPK